MSTYSESKKAADMLNDIDSKINTVSNKIKDYESAISLMKIDLNNLIKEKDKWRDYYYNSEMDCNNEAREEY